MENRLSSETGKFVEGVERMIDGTPRMITRADNNPPSLVALLCDQLAETYKLEFEKVDPLRKRANATAQRITTDEELAVWTGIYNDAKTLFDALDMARKNEKRPFTEAVDSTFSAKTSPLANIMGWVRQKADTFNRDKLQKQRAEEAAERERLAAIERQAREDARIAAEFGETDKAIEHIQQAAQVAQQAETSAAPARASDTTRVRGESGGVASAASVWKFRVADYAAIDLNALRGMIAPAEIDKAIARIVKIQRGATKIGGVEVYEDVGTSFRK